MLTDAQMATAIADLANLADNSDKDLSHEDIAAEILVHVDDVPSIIDEAVIFGYVEIRGSRVKGKGQCF